MKEDGPWLGWITMGLACFLSAGFSALYTMGYSVPINALSLFGMIYVLHLLLLPFCSIYSWLRGRNSHARQALYAFAVFLILIMVQVKFSRP